MWSYYWRLLREVPTAFREVWEASAFWTSIGIVVLGVSVPVLSRLELSGWYTLIPVGGFFLWAILRANYRNVEDLTGKVERTVDRKARQAVVDQLSDYRMDACNLLAKPVRSDADYVAWQSEANTWAETVGPILTTHFEHAVRRKFDFVGLHQLLPVADAYNADHHQGIMILNYKVKVLEGIIGDGIAQPKS